MMNINTESGYSSPDPLALEKDTKYIKKYTKQKSHLLFIHDFILYLFVISIATFLLLLNTWYLYLVSLFLYIAFIPLFLSLFLFKSITIYTNKIELEQTLFGIQILLISDIKSIELNSTGFILFPFFRVKNNYFKKYYFVATVLPYKDCYELLEIVNKLLKKES